MSTRVRVGTNEANEKPQNRQHLFFFSLLWSFLRLRPINQRQRFFFSLNSFFLEERPRITTWNACAICGLQRRVAIAGMRALVLKDRRCRDCRLAGAISWARAMSKSATQ